MVITIIPTKAEIQIVIISLILDFSFSENDENLLLLIPLCGGN